MADPNAELEAANAEFYRAFAARDLARMDGAWATAASVACIHPGWPMLNERAAIMESWRAILTDLPNEGGEDTVVRCAEPKTTVQGEMGYVICRELLGPYKLLATNVFVREDDAWKMVHHHAAPVYADEAPIKPQAPGSLN